MRVPVADGSLVQRGPGVSERFVAADSGGSGLGEGLQKLGQGLGQVAEAQEQIRTKLDDTGAKTLDVAGTTGATKIVSDFKANRGLTAGVARPDAEKALDDLQTSLLAQATTPRMKRMLTDVMSQRVAMAKSEIANHAIGQIEAAGDSASIARQSASSEAAIATDDPKVRAQNLQTGLNEISSYGASKGWAPEQIKGEQFKYESKIHAAIARNMLDGDNVDGAQAYLNQNKDRIADSDEAHIREALSAPLLRRETNGDVDNVMGTATRDAPATFTYKDPLHGAGRPPVAGGEFGAGRDYGGHQGVDLPAPMGSGIYATAPGTVSISHSDKGGNIVTVQHADGITSRYMHLGDVKVADGDQVTPDTVLGTVGMTGRSTGPHVHWEMLKDGKPVDPETLLGQVRQSPQRHDMNALLAQVDHQASEQGWSPERVDRAKGEIERRVGRDEQLATRVEEQAQRNALDTIDKLPDRGFTSLTQLPADVRASLSPSDTHRFQDMARENIKAAATDAKAKADGDTALGLNLMAIEDKDTFAKRDLRMDRNAMTPGEFASLTQLQAKIRTNPDGPDAMDHSRIWSTIHTYAPDLGLDLGTKGGRPNNPTARAESMQIFTMMKSDLDATTQGKRKPTDDEVKAAFDRSVMTVKAPGGFFGRSEALRRSQLNPQQQQNFQVDVPNDVRARIVSSYQRTAGRAPSSSEIGETYIRHKGQAGFWQ
jgi:murein DD-endopeptidase MepM/ murein hydrolase activator NlpD